MMAATGQAKKMARNASGTAASTTRALPLAAARRSLRSLCVPLSAARAVRSAHCAFRAGSGRPLAHLSTVWVQVEIHWSRCAAMSCGLSVSGLATGGAKSVNSGGRATPSRTG